MDIDLNDHGDPHWLSGKGKANREAIRRKHRAVHLLTRESVKKPASPETRAKLEKSLLAYNEKALAKAKAKIETEKQAAGKSGKEIVAIFNTALAILDASEPAMREMIESDLMDFTGPNSTKRNGAKKATEALMKKITAVRVKAIKDAFKHLRANLPHE